MTGVLFLPYRQDLSLNRKLTILTRLTAHHGPRICLFQLPNAGEMGMCQLSYAWPFMCAGDLNLSPCACTAKALEPQGV